MLGVQKLIFDYGIEEANRILKEEYFLKIREYDKFYVYDYDQINSPKTHPITIQSRGIIIDYKGEIISRAFDRFFNYGESPETTQNFDFSRANVLEKADGSLIKVYFNPYANRWEIATRGTAFAEGPHDFYPSFRAAVLADGFRVSEDEFQEFANDSLYKNRTYVFEYTSPLNRVVTRYTESKMVALGITNNDTGEHLVADEIDELHWMGMSNNVRTIRRYSYDTVDEMLESTNNLPNLEEGYVLYDEVSNIRIKVKSLKYVEVHRIRGEGKPTPKSICTLILENEQSEFLTYFSEFRELFVPYEEKLSTIEANLHTAWNLYKDIESQKDFALAIKDLTGASILFTMRNKGVNFNTAWKDAKMNYKLSLLGF